MANTLLQPLRLALVILIFVSCGIGVVIAQSHDTDSILGRVILIEPKQPKGALKVKQGKRVDPVNAVEGMLVRRGYLLILNPTARATIICGDGYKRELAPGPQGCPCTKSCTPEVCGIRYDGSTISGTRGPDTDAGLFPVVISPRKSMLRNLRPTIRWAPIAGAKDGTTYSVILFGEGMKVIWSRNVVSGTWLIYPDKEPSLTNGQTYKVVVTSNGLSSEQDHSPGLGFTALTADQARALADDETKRKQLKLPETQTRFLIANLYAGRELYAEAIEQLQELHTTMKEPALTGMLGDLYATIGLNREAAKWYLETLGVTPADDLEGMGATQKSLAQVYENLGIYDKAMAQLKEAIKAYRRLGNRAIVRLLFNEERRLEETRRRQ